MTGARRFQAGRERVGLRGGRRRSRGRKGKPRGDAGCIVFGAEYAVSRPEPRPVANPVGPCAGRRQGLLSLSPRSLSTGLACLVPSLLSKILLNRR